MKTALFNDTPKSRNCYENCKTLCSTGLQSLGVIEEKYHKHPACDFTQAGSLRYSGLLQTDRYCVQRDSKVSESGVQNKKREKLKARKARKVEKQGSKNILFNETPKSRSRVSKMFCCSAVRIGREV